MADLIQDLRYAARSLRRSPAFALVAVLTLGLGIGANAAIFSLVNGVLLKPPSGVADPSRIVGIYTSDYSSGPYGSTSYPDFEAIRRAVPAFSGVAAFALRPLALTAGQRSEMVMGQEVSGDFFPTLGTVPLAGRLLGPADARVKGEGAVAVLGEGLWRRRFGGDPAVVGRDIRVNGQTLRVVGVAPPGFTGLMRGIATDLWVPATIHPLLQPGSDELTGIGSRAYLLLARLAPGATIRQAREQLSAVARERYRQFPDAWETVSGAPRALTVLPESETRLPPQVRGMALGAAAILLGAVGLVLLVACANMANLLLARASRRRREMALRVSLGATRTHLVRNVLAESALLAALGAIAGLLLAGWVTGATRVVQLPTLPVTLSLDLALDARVLAFTAAVTLVTAVAFGLVPALRASRADPASDLKGEATPSPRRWLSLRNGLVVAQLAISLVLLVVAGLFVRSLGRAAAVDPGFDPSHTALMTFDLESSGFGEARGSLFFGALLERVRALPGVSSATLTRQVPLADCCSRRGTIIEGYAPRRGESTEIDWSVVATDYFRTSRIPLVQGRDFDPRDRARAPLVAIVNQAFARRYWPGQDPIGHRLRLMGPDAPPTEVVGVARDARYRSLREDPRPFMYVPLAQEYRPQMILQVRTTGDPAAAIPVLREQVRALAPGLPVIRPTTMEEAVGVSLLPHRLGALLLGALGALAALLAALGLYGVVAYSVAQRTREFGIRSALGANRNRIVRQVLGEGMALSAVGAGIGIAIAAVLTRVLTSFLFGVAPLDPASFGGVTLLLAAITLGASWLPALRATRVNPMQALRAE